MALRAPLRRSLVTGLVVGAVAALAALVFRAVYLAAGGTPFAEITVVSTLLAALVPTILAALFYGELAARTRRARHLFTTLVLVVAWGSAFPIALAPPHPGFGWLAAPLHVLVGALIAFGIPWHLARGASVSVPRGAAAPARGR